MDTTVKKNIRQRIYGVLTSRLVYHTIFWVAMLLTLTFLDNDARGFSFSLAVELVNIFFYGLVVYFNLFYLIPNYLTDKRFLLYCALLIASVVLITPIKVITLYLLHANSVQDQQSIINIQIWVFISTFMIAGSSTVFKIITDWVRYQRDRIDLQTQTMQSELKFLKSQINPHFLFNTLNNLYALTLKKSDKAPEIVIKLSEMMRYMLYECNEKRVLLSKEVHYLHNYLDLERLRQGKNVKIDFKVKGNVTNQKIAPLMFIPFLENSFKHGLNNQISRGFVNIVMEVYPDAVHVFIENSKAESLPQQSHKRSGGIGLVNVRRRLNLLYPESYDLKIHDHPKTYAVELKIDLDK